MANGDSCRPQFGGKNLGNIKPSLTHDPDKADDGGSSEAGDDGRRPWATKSVPKSAAHCESPTNSNPSSDSGDQCEDEDIEDERDGDGDDIEGDGHGNEADGDDEYDMNDEDDGEDEESAADGISHPLTCLFNQLTITAADVTPPSSSTARTRLRNTRRVRLRELPPPCHSYEPIK
jgi:hypothetical protein